MGVVEDQTEPRRQCVEGVDEVGDELEIDACSGNHESPQPAVRRDAGTSTQSRQHRPPEPAWIFVVLLDVHPGGRHTAAASRPLGQEERLAVPRRRRDQRERPLVAAIQNLHERPPVNEVRGDRRRCDPGPPHAHGSPSPRLATPRSPSRIMIRGPAIPVRDVSKMLTLKAPQFLEKSTFLDARPSAHHDPFRQGCRG